MGTFLRVAMVVVLGSLPTVVCRSPAVGSDAGEGKLLLLLDSSAAMDQPDATGGTAMITARRGLATVFDRISDDAMVGLRVYGATRTTGPGACTDTHLRVPIGAGRSGRLSGALASSRPAGR